MDVGFSLYPNSKCWVPYFVPCSSKLATSVFSSSVRERGGIGSNGALSQNVVFRSSCKGSTGLEARSVKRSCGSSFDELSNEELAKKIEGLAEQFYLPDEDGGGFDFREDMEKYKDVIHAISNCYRCSVLKNTADMEEGLSTRFSPVKFETLEPSLLGIQPEPPDWPERNEIARSIIERKANSVQLPLSLRIIQKKNQWLWREGFEGVVQNYKNSSMNKAFASMVYTIQALQSHAFYMSETQYAENFHGLLAKAQREMNMSFVWLFQHVFWRTPSLTVYLTVLLANFLVFSISEKTATEAIPSSMIEGILSMAGDRTMNVTPNTSESRDWEGRSSSSTTISYPDVVRKETTESALHGDNKLTAEELKLWNSVVHEASRLAEESGTCVLDYDTLNQFISPVSVEVEADNFEDYRKTDLSYQMSILQEPNNPLLLSNYGQFLYLVSHDYDRAEIDPQDSEALIRYADFLWIVRKDAWGAEERYLQAVAADPCNSHHASKYANFLWSTGGEETCFPLTSYNQ